MPVFSLVKRSQRRPILGMKLLLPLVLILGAVLFSGCDAFAFYYLSRQPQKPHGSDAPTYEDLNQPPRNGQDGDPDEWEVPSRPEDYIPPEA